VKILTIAFLPLAMVMACSSTTYSPPRWVVDGQRLLIEHGQVDGPAEYSVISRKIRYSDELYELTPVIQDFVMRHEFGHAMGFDETGSDRFAIEQMKADRILLASDVARIASWLQTEASDGGRTHPPGVVRAAVVILAGVR